MAVIPFLPTRHPVIEGGELALMTGPWQEWARGVQGIVVNINTIPGVNRKTYADLNALGLGASDADYVAWEPNYGHALQWTGAVWQFAPGDGGNGYFSHRPVAPQEAGWQACDGTISDYLTVGGITLTVTPFTVPNVTAGTFLKVLAAYTGTIEAAIAANISGSTASAGDHNHDVNAHRHALSTNASAAAGVDHSIATSQTQDDIFDDSGTSTDGAHAHGAGSLAASSAARPPSLGGLLFFRR